MRIGCGFDFHKFAGTGPITLAGVQIPYKHGIAAHSDGDVVYHAVCDALLGAAALGDIGEHFPDSDPKWHNAPSSSFLRYTLDLLQQHNYKISNIDLTIITEAPKIGPHKLKMQQNFAEVLKIALNQVNIKATTMEGSGAIGREEGIAVQAVALLFEAKKC